MENINIGGFEFPNSINAKCAIARACKFLIENGPCDMTTMRQYALKLYYSDNSIRLGALNHAWVEYPENHKNFKESAINILWTRKKEGRSFKYYPTEHTQNAAKLWDSLHKQFDDKNNKSLDAKTRKLQRILEMNKDLKVGDMVITNPINHPDPMSNFLRDYGYECREFVLKDFSINFGPKYGKKWIGECFKDIKEGIIIGEIDIVTGVYSEAFNACIDFPTHLFIVMHNNESTPRYYPITALKKLKK